MAERCQQGRTTIPSPSQKPGDIGNRCVSVRQLAANRKTSWGQHVVSPGQMRLKLQDHRGKVCFHPSLCPTRLKIQRPTVSDEFWWRGTDCRCDDNTHCKVKHRRFRPAGQCHCLSNTAIGKQCVSVASRSNGANDILAVTMNIGTNLQHRHPPVIRRQWHQQRLGWQTWDLHRMPISCGDAKGKANLLGNRRLRVMMQNEVSHGTVTGFRSIYRGTMHR